MIDYLYCVDRIAAIPADCKSAAQWASGVRVPLGAQVSEANVATKKGACAPFVRDEKGFSHIFETSKRSGEGKKMGNPY